MGVSTLVMFLSIIINSHKVNAYIKQSSQNLNSD